MHIALSFGGHKISAPFTWNFISPLVFLFYYINLIEHRAIEELYQFKYEASFISITLYSHHYRQVALIGFKSACSLMVLFRLFETGKLRLCDYESACMEMKLRIWVLFVDWGVWYGARNFKWPKWWKTEGAFKDGLILECYTGSLDWWAALYKLRCALS